MKQVELVQKICTEARIKNKAAAGRAVKCIVSTIVDTVKSGERITIAGLGTFGPKDRKPRKGRNPKTGETIEIPANRTIRFKPSLSLKKL